jgi:proprotein convertase P-domain-containing protein
MNSGHPRIARVLVLIAAGVLALALTAAPAVAKKKKNKAAVVSAAVGAPIPESSTGPFTVGGTPLRTSLVVGKKFKGKHVRNVAVTFKTTGSAPDAGGDLSFLLSAPDGTTVFLAGQLFTQSIGPLTLVPNSPVTTCSVPTFLPPPPPTCGPETLAAPFAGTAGAAPLRWFDGLSMRGTWTLRVSDTNNAPNTSSTLDSWGLRITPAKSSQ